jgi:ankyrin repeat protein
VRQLLRAARRGALDDARALLTADEAPPVDAPDDRNARALYLAARGGHEEVVRLLLEHGADIDARNNQPGKTALVGAAEKGHEGVVRTLLELGADATIESRGKTAEDLASTEAIKALLRVRISSSLREGACGH